MMRAWENGDFQIYLMTSKVLQRTVDKLTLFFQITQSRTYSLLLKDPEKRDQEKFSSESTKATFYWFLDIYRKTSVTDRFLK